MKTIIIDNYALKEERVFGYKRQQGDFHSLIRVEVDRQDGGQQERKQRSCRSVLRLWVRRSRSAVLPVVSYVAT